MNVNRNITFPIRNRGRGNRNRGHASTSFSNNQKDKSNVFVTPIVPNPFNRSSSTNTPKSHSTSTKTPQSSTSNDTDSYHSRVYLAISEGRGQAREEVGIASVDLCTPKLLLYQFSDKQGYPNTLRIINVLNPVEIFVPSTFLESQLPSRVVQMVSEQFKDVKITTVHRKWFDGNCGMHQVHNLCADVYKNGLLDIQYKYYALAAVAALLQHLEYEKSATFIARSLKIVYLQPESYVAIDVDTAYRLELVTSTQGSNRYSSLFGVLNNCLTSAGIRLLRSTILQPSCSVDFINARLDCVQELIHNPDLLSKLRGVLPKFHNVDFILTLCMKIPDYQRASAAKTQLNYTLNLKSILDVIPNLSKVLERTNSDFFVKAKSHLNHPQFQEILNDILKDVNTDSHFSRGHAGDLQRCFIVKSGKNALLDIARKIYSEIIDDMTNMVKELSEKYNLPLTVNHNCTKGFHIQLKLRPHQRSMKSIDLPPEFINVVKHQGSFSMTTMKMIEFSQRLKDSRNEIEATSNIIICCLLTEIRKKISGLYTLCEFIAELDLLQSFAKACSITNHCRPSFKTYSHIVNGRHPMLDYLCETEPMANDAFATTQHNFHIITGPNMSGKSVYIRQIALLQILAQIGMFLPAQKAYVRIADKILSCIGFDDNIECNASTFQMNMREIQSVLNSITDNSLVIIDELCRGTVSDEGTSIGWALCEELIKSKAFIFFTTHFHMLTKLADMYYNVSNWHLDTKEVHHKSGVRLSYTHKLVYGVTSIESYGLTAARMSALPQSVIERAEVHVKNLTEKVKPQSKSESNVTKDLLTYNLISEVKLMKEKKTINNDTIKKLITTFKQNINLENKNSNVYMHVTSDTSYCSSAAPPSIVVERKDILKPNDSSNTTITSVNTVTKLYGDNIERNKIYTPSTIENDSNIENKTVCTDTPIIQNSGTKIVGSDSSAIEIDSIEGTKAIGNNTSTMENDFHNGDKSFYANNPIDSNNGTNTICTNTPTNDSNNGAITPTIRIVSNNGVGANISNFEIGSNNGTNTVRANTSTMRIDSNNGVKTVGANISNFKIDSNNGTNSIWHCNKRAITPIRRIDSNNGFQTVGANISNFKIDSNNGVQVGANISNFEIDSNNGVQVGANISNFEIDSKNGVQVGANISNFEIDSNNGVQVGANISNFEIDSNNGVQVCANISNFDTDSNNGANTVRANTSTMRIDSSKTVHTSTLTMETDSINGTKTVCNNTSIMEIDFNNGTKAVRANTSTIEIDSNNGNNTIYNDSLQNSFNKTRFLEKGRITNDFNNGTKAVRANTSTIEIESNHGNNTIYTDSLQNSRFLETGRIKNDFTSPREKILEKDTENENLNKDIFLTPLRKNIVNDTSSSASGNKSPLVMKPHNSPYSSSQNKKKCSMKDINLRNFFEMSKKFKAEATDVGISSSKNENMMRYMRYSISVDRDDRVEFINNTANSSKIKNKKQKPGTLLRKASNDFSNLLSDVNEPIFNKYIEDTEDTNNGHQIDPRNT